MVGQVAVADGGSDGGDAVGGAGDFGEMEVVDVDEGGGMLDAGAHEVDEVGAAAEELGSVGGDGMDGCVGGGGALVVEGIHARGSLAAARTAATMLG